MIDYLFLIPISLGLALIGLVAFFWALRANQYNDLDGAAHRVLVDEDHPLIADEVDERENDGTSNQ